MIVDILAANSQKAALATLMATSNDLYFYVADILYKELEITHANARKIFCGLPEYPRRHSHYRRRKRKPAITWAEFRHPDHYLDWAAAVDWGHNENLRRRKRYAVWPMADADSDDSEEEGVDADVSSSALKYPYPTESSRMRKRSLLHRVQCLKLVEVPPRDVVRMLDQSARIRGRNHYFSSVRQISLGAKLVWALIDYEDRHRRLEHPYTSFIKDIDTVESLCIHLPTPDSHLERAFMEARMVTHEEHLSRSSENDQFTYLRLQLRNVLRSGHIDSVMDNFCREDPWKDVTIHGVTTPLLFVMDSSHLRTFFRPCSCRQLSAASPIDDGFCYNHFETREDFDTYQALQMGKTTRGGKTYKDTWDFIDFERICERKDCACGSHTDTEDREAEALWKQVEETRGAKDMEHMKEHILFLQSEDVEVCVCCGERQLSRSIVSCAFCFVTTLHTIWF